MKTEGILLDHENICCGTHWKHLNEMLPMSTQQRDASNEFPHHIYF